MTARPAAGGASVRLRRSVAPTRLARWAVRISAVVAAALVVSFAIFAVAYGIGGWGAIDDTWVGFVVAVSLLGGLLASLVAFTLAVTSKVKHERWAMLWLPLSLFPAILAFLVLGELFWWE
jgi:hypothetical protein